ncbi:hypothetical protein Pmar_PMAR014698 [Perkinsus marinus ATCC 50983]|uniref:EF-hand domain-containing protein n=1 Tax=Perkinsus marinus (strain ATCC 50983 / TXsc) TaxID=423536 RepID=C5LIS6_PERM5|nr:hypothetical protein Pmar_PMAR014698 [Perkinsus marinus ATCC 50983]EER03479.1 hypothetical protein Pmar_PMAR014698 [Perkinsus marinus ATCC 50983]|eukprot:XP_002771663.1 hypothetical protein Pmar_PMAR014698 [Perkinsus marinus ATCC 50983]
MEEEEMLTNSKLEDVLKVDSLVEVAKIHSGLRRVDATEADLVRTLGITAEVAEQCMDSLTRDRKGSRTGRVASDELIAGLAWYCGNAKVSERLTFLEEANIPPVAVVIGVARVGGFSYIPTYNGLTSSATPTDAAYAARVRVGLKALGVDIAQEDEDNSANDSDPPEWMNTLREGPGARRAYIPRQPLREVTALSPLANRRFKLEGIGDHTSSCDGPNMTTDQVEELQYVFLLLDTDNTGYIKVDDLIDILGKIGRGVNTEILSRAYESSHSAEERLITLSDILRILSPNCSHPVIEGIIHEHGGVGEEAAVLVTYGQSRSSSSTSGRKSTPQRPGTDSGGTGESVTSRVGTVHQSPRDNAQQEAVEAVEISLERLMELRRLFDCMIDYEGKGVVDLRRLREYFSTALNDPDDLDRVLIGQKGERVLEEDASDVLYTRDDFIRMILPEGLVPCAYPTPRSVRASSNELWRSRHARRLESASNVPTSLKASNDEQQQDSPQVSEPLLHSGWPLLAFVAGG